MFDPIGWATVIISLIASFISAGIALFLRKMNDTYREGGLNQRINYHDKQLDRQERINTELLGRLTSLEKGYAAMPGQIGKIFDERIEKLRVYWREDMENTVYRIINDMSRKNKPK